MPAQLPEPLYVRDLDEFDERRQAHAESARRGTEVRLARGAYLPVSKWVDLDAREQYLLTVRAVACTRRDRLVLSHWSAAVIHELPILGSWPDRIHVTVGRVSGGRSRRSVVKHALVLADDEVVEIDGMLVTSIARTVLDLAVSADRRTAIMAIDRALLIDRLGRRPAMLTKEELWGCYSARGNFWGSRRARALIEFGATAAESPLESVSRLSMHAIRCPPPELQAGFRDHDGAIGNADFFWRKHGLVGEADGELKYLDPVILGDRSTSRVLMDEKYREDRIRALGNRMTRWPWITGVNPAALRLHLQRAGLPIP